MRLKGKQTSKSIFNMNVLPVVDILRSIIFFLGNSYLYFFLSISVNYFSRVPCRNGGSILTPEISFGSNAVFHWIGDVFQYGFFV